VKIITEPSVYVLTRQHIDQTELDRFLADHNVTWASDSAVGAEVVAETAGRICYMSFASPRPGGNAAYLAHIKEVSHGSVFEHAVWTLLFTGVSRTLTHELVRHRAGFGFSQLSQRYVDESVAEYVVPPDLREEVEAGMSVWTCSWFKCQFDRDEYECLMGDKDKLSAAELAGIEWIYSIATAHAAYVKLAEKLTAKLEPELARRYRENPDLNAGDPDQRTSDLGLIARNRTERRKAARQAARSVLPNATETKITVTGNCRAWRHLIEQRGSRFAEPEIRRLANRVLDVLQTEAPNLFSDYVRTELPDGTFEITTAHTKV
jgi:thymidylate synthase (FAD)